MHLVTVLFVNDIRGRRVVLTGGSGFLGRCVKQRLQALSPSSIHIPRSASCDLRDRRQIENLFSDCRPEIVVHLAAVVGALVQIGRTREAIFMTTRSWELN